MSSSNRVAIVTGSAQGIGRAIALRLAQDGFNLVLNDLPNRQQKLEDLQKKITSIGEDRKCIIAVADVSNEEEVHVMVNKAVELGGIDVMVANAGVSTIATFLDHDVETFERTFNINVRGVFLCLKYASLEMIKRGKGGKLIAASSAVGINADANTVAYSASKFAVRAIIQTAALEFGQYGITANAYAPGAIYTEMMADFVDNHPERLDQFKKRSLLNRVGKPEEVAGIVSYLASPEGDFITGQTMSINGGWNMH